MEHKHEPIRATMALLGIAATMKDDASPEDRAKATQWLADAEEYWSHFVVPIALKGDGSPDQLGARCFHCGDYLTGMGAVLVSEGGGFRWGLVHGEGSCGHCGWPVRAHHFAKTSDGAELFTVRNFPLSYHPDHVERRVAAD